MEGLDFKVGQQLFNLPVRELAAFDAVDDPMLSMVATLRRADGRSGAKVPRARQAPLNSSSSAMKPRISGVILRLAGWITTPDDTPNYTQFVKRPKKRPFTPIIEILPPHSNGHSWK